MNNLPASPTGFNALSLPQQKEHRAKIGVRVQAILGQFWQDAETADAVKAIEIEGWVDVLESCSHSEIRAAWRDYQTDSRNRTARGRLAKPDPGAIRAIIFGKRPKSKVVSDEQEDHETPKEPRMTGARAEEIMLEIGFKPRRFGGSK